VDRLSQNQGAESTLAFLLALAEQQALQNTLTSFKEPASENTARFPVPANNHSMTKQTTSTLHAKRIGPTLVPDRSRVLMRPFRPTTDDIARRVVARVMALPEEEVARLLGQVLGEFADRHEHVEDFFSSVSKQVKHLSRTRRRSRSVARTAMLIGAYFTHEYSPESAALFNPSIVPHPDQTGVPRARCVSS
jgi:hypothetical protein